jgi:hypothetical protein
MMITHGAAGWKEAEHGGTPRNVVAFRDIGAV